MRIVISIVLAICIGLGSCKKNSSKSGTCYDGIKNQDETAVDCGGKCSKCPTCSDGIQNQGETSIDCGGACANCPLTFKPKGNYGVNILTDTVTTLHSSSDASPIYYSICTQMPENSSLKVAITLADASPNANQMILNTLTIQGWGVYIVGQKRTYFADGEIYCDAGVYCKGHNTATLEFYENGAAVATRTKTIAW